MKQRRGMTVILNFGLSAWDIALSRKRFFLSLKICSVTITFYNFEWKYTKIIELLHRILTVKHITLDYEGTKNYINSYLESSLQAEERDRLAKKRK